MENSVSLDESATLKTLSMEDIVAKHRKEKKELQAQIQKLKHSVPKGDKKKKKEVTDQIAKLEAEQVARHEHEVSTFTQDDESKERGEGESIDTVSEVEGQYKQGNNTCQEPTGRKSKAQKRRVHLSSIKSCTSQFVMETSTMYDETSKNPIKSKF
ncbi:hypothetical protein RRG08_028212 [Elysia crispata]|uniref:Uncharacterized protein n=1 Tax=Elysia crispata TaxID=231223 RepID=A0AAE0YBD2_9GAST|nr:hypothetical protein RRG08_028212 [Elysia crispata]